MNHSNTSHFNWENPMGTDGFEFIEYCSNDPSLLEELFLQLGFKAVAKHKRKNVTLYRQGEINFIVNAESPSFGGAFSMLHGPSVCAIALRFENADAAYKKALEYGAEPWNSNLEGAELRIPAIKGVGGSLIYFVDRYADDTIYDVDFDWIPNVDRNPKGHGLHLVDHLTHNVHRGRMQQWASFYEDLFNFKEIRHFDIEGKLTGLRSKAMTSPCGKIRIPINESIDEKSQIEEFLELYKGEGIQHIALSTENIYETVENLRKSGVRFLSTPQTYYELLPDRLPGHGEDVRRLSDNQILLDGASSQEGSRGNKLLLQIFTETVIGPIFFEIIQRKGDDGFGEGNFQALFDSIEMDQIERGFLEANHG